MKTPSKAVDQKTKLATPMKPATPSKNKKNKVATPATNITNKVATPANNKKNKVGTPVNKKENKVGTPANKKENKVGTPANKKANKVGTPANKKTNKVTSPASLTLNKQNGKQASSKIYNSNDFQDSSATMQLTVQITANGTDNCHKEPLIAVLNSIQHGKLTGIGLNFARINYTSLDGLKADEKTIKSIKLEGATLVTAPKSSLADPLARKIYVGHGYKFDEVEKSLNATFSGIVSVSKITRGGLLKVCFDSAKNATKVDGVEFNSVLFSPYMISEREILAGKRKLEDNVTDVETSKDKSSKAKKLKVEVKEEEDQEDEEDDNDEESEDQDDEDGADDDDEGDDDDDDEGDDDDDDDEDDDDDDE